MLHELLFVLSGYPGDVFVPVPSPPQTAKTYAIARDFPLLHPTERDALNHMGHLGWIYAQLCRFINNTLQPQQKQDVYRQALATCLSTVLGDYRTLILTMESRIVTKQDQAGQGIVPLSMISSHLGRWDLILPGLLRLTEKIQQQQQQQILVLDILMDQVRTGIPELHNAMVYMLGQLHNVFYRQLTAWMIYGHLPACTDFFITPKQSSTDTTEWQRYYQIVPDRIPNHFSLDVATSIFYVGNVMATIQTKKNQQQQKLVMPNSMKQYHLQLLQSLQSSSSSSFQQIDGSTIWTQQSQLLTQVVNRIRRSTTTWLFSQVFQQEHNLVKYFTSFRQLFLLGDGDLAVKWLEGLQYISLSSSSSPGKRRRRRQEEEGESLSQTDMKDHHHMDIWQQQKREWRALLVKASIGTDSEDQLDGYTFDTFDTKDTFESLLAIDEDEDHHHYGGRLVYTLQWPIDLFLGEQDMARYSSLWSFLMGLKKVQMALSHVFTTTTADQGQVEVEGQEDDEDDDDPGERLIWRLRSMMLFWIDTLWSHVQGNVITRHYDQLMMACQPTTSSTVPLDFDKVQEAHEHYLMELTRGCLLSTTECRKALIILLQTCMNFCNMVRNEAPLKKKKKKINKKPMSAAEIVSTWTRQLDTTGSTARMEQLSILEETFTQNSDHLFDLLSNQQQDMKISGHLTELLMRLDYNKWYSGQRYKHIPDPLDY